MSKKLQDLAGVLRGVQNVLQAGAKLQENELKIIWLNSSIRSAARELNLRQKPWQGQQSSKSVAPDLASALTETSERISTVLVGLREYSNLNLNNSGGKSKLIL